MIRDNSVEATTNQSIGMNGLQVSKVPDKTTYSVGNTVTFTIAISNTSNRTASSVILTDNIPSGSNFITASLTLDGVSASASNFFSFGILIGDMNPGDSHTVTYQIIINSMLSPNPVKNNPAIIYDYIDYTGATQIGIAKGRTTQFTVVPAGNNNIVPVMKLTKTPDQNSYAVGDIVTFTIVVANKRGKLANSVILTDTVPNIATFITSSLTLDGNSISGLNFLGNGLSLGNMAIGASHTITYQMTINSMPNLNPVENDPIITYNYVNYSGVTKQVSLTGATAPFTVSQSVGNGSGIPDMKLTKTPDQSVYSVGDVVTFTIGIQNLDGEDASSVVLTDNIPNEAAFINSSLTLDGISVSGISFINNGLAIGYMAIGDSHTVTYQMVINSMPASMPVENDPAINYDYVDNTGATQIGTLTGMTTPFTVLAGGVGSNGSPVMRLTKAPDQASYYVGNTVTFTILISNTDGGVASNIVLTDNIPNSVAFIPASLNLDGTFVDGTNFLNNGLAISDMNVGDSHTITYQMTLNSMPNPNHVKNNPVINYDYVDTTGANAIGTLTGTTTPFTVVPNGSGNCCCCCCPCICNYPNF